MNVRVSIDTLNNEIKKLESYNSEFSDSIKNIKSIVEDLGNCWEAAAYETFSSKMEVFLSELENIRKQVDSYREFAYGYVTAETTLNSSYSGKNLGLE